MANNDDFLDSSGVPFDRSTERRAAEEAEAKKVSRGIEASLRDWNRHYKEGKFFNSPRSYMDGPPYDYNALYGDWQSKLPMVRDAKSANTALKELFDKAPKDGQPGYYTIRAAVVEQLRNLQRIFGDEVKVEEVSNADRCR